MLSSNLLLFSLAILIITLLRIPNIAYASLEETNALLEWKSSLQIPRNSLLSSWIPLPMNSSASVQCTSRFGVVCNADWSIHRAYARYVFNIDDLSLKLTLQFQTSYDDKNRPLQLPIPTASTIVKSEIILR
ncbi:unnamed protein product [Lactuca saligna]|uniref:Leucine-rich repeat-containing N-terminal plant-type domain-containing protein n=1 Tax=Lactuca saligna TaxID=75948 RepID=A0AA35YLA6_LACSI|nr:unnamed protein product [Lactuca saligna]